MYSKKSFIMRPALALMCASAFGLFAANANAADPIKIGYVGGIIRRLRRPHAFGGEGDEDRPAGNQCRRRGGRAEDRDYLARFQDQAGRGRQAGARSHPDREGPPADRRLLEFGVHGLEPGLEAVWHPADQRYQRHPQGDGRFRSPQRVPDPAAHPDGRQGDRRICRQEGVEENRDRRSRLRVGPHHRGGLLRRAG